MVDDSATDVGTKVGSFRCFQALPLHAHVAKHLMIVNAESHFVRRDADGVVLLGTRVMEPPYVMPLTLDAMCRYCISCKRFRETR